MWRRIVPPYRAGSLATHGRCRAWSSWDARRTARRRMTVEDLMKAGLSIRTIAAGTGIPRSSVHRAMRAVARAQAKQQVAIADIAYELLGKRLRHSGGGRP
jgi:IS30 family transposase